MKEAAMSLADKRVLVVGGGSGIGLAVAEAAKADGAHVTIASTNAERIAAAAGRMNAEGLTLDITDEAAVAAFFAGAADGFDHVVTTAGDWGGMRRGPLADTDLKAAESVFRVRVWGALTLAKHAAPAVTPGGSITLTDGMIAHRPTKGSAISTAMAGAIEHLTRGLAVELSPVRVNCVCPGLIRTEIWDTLVPDAERREAQLEAMTKGQLIPRAGHPSETAEAYLYLMRGGYTTGQVLYVEGGRTLGG
jgi:NAD(P)-dependent dehydrogenase (short-subunit alcohol dehydrogenase family)